MDFDKRRQRQLEFGAPARKANAYLGVMQDDVENAQNSVAEAANYIDEAIKQGRIPEYVGRELIREVRSIDAAIGLYR